MPPKTLFVPKEFSNELTDLIEKNPTVEEVICHNLLSQTYRNEGLKFLNFFYDPEELDKENANLPNLDHLVDLALNKDAEVNIPKDGSNSIGQINRNASNILSGPSKRLRDLAMKDPQRRIFKQLRGFYKTKSAKNSMFAGHFQRIFENYLSSYESEFKPQSNDFYHDDFSMKSLINFMIKHIRILSYRDFLTHFVTTFGKSFSEESKYALEEILSTAGRYIFAIENLFQSNDNSSESSESGERSNSQQNNSDESTSDQLYKNFCAYEEKIQPISIEEKPLPIPIYMKSKDDNPIPPFKELYKEYEALKEDYQLSHPTTRNNRKRGPGPGLPLPSKTSGLPLQGAAASPNRRGKRYTVEPDALSPTKKRSQTNLLNLPSLLNLDDADPKKRSKQLETQSTVDILERQKLRNMEHRRSVNFGKDGITAKSDSDRCGSDSEKMDDRKIPNRRKRSLSFRGKAKKPKDEKKLKKSDKIEEGYLDGDSSDDDSNGDDRNPIILHSKKSKREFIDDADFENSMKEFVHYDDHFIEKLKAKMKKKKKKFNAESLNLSAFFLISLVRNAFAEDSDFFKVFRSNDALLQMLLICGTFCDDNSRLSSEVFTIVRSIIVGHGDDCSKGTGVQKSGDNKDDSDKDSSSGSDDDNDKESAKSTSNTSSPSSSSTDGDGATFSGKSSSDLLVDAKWEIPDFVADFAEYFTFDPFHVTPKMISAFQVFWNFRSPKYQLYDTFVYRKYISNRHQKERRIPLSNATSDAASTDENFGTTFQPREKDLILDYPSFEGRVYRKPEGKTPLEVMTPVFFTEPPLSDSFNHQFRKILTALGKQRKKLTGSDITKSEHIDQILEIDIIYIEFMRNTFDLSITDAEFQRLHVINAIEKMLEMYPCNNNYWQNNGTVARSMLNGHIEKLSRWSMKYQFLVVGKNGELSNIAFLLPGPKVATAANYAQTTFDIENLKDRFKNKLFKIDLGCPSDDQNEEEEDYGEVSDLDF